MLRPDVPLNVLDLVWRSHGQSTADAARASVDLARRAERLGYHRHWFAEHHGLPVSLSSAPLILMGAVAAATTTLRVGSGGLQLPNHSPLSVAEQVGTLRALHGDRIDLGIGRSPGADGPTARALRRAPAPDSATYEQEVRDLLAYVHGSVPGDTVPRPVATPGLGDAPETWLLGSSSGTSARLAGELGLPFAYAHHVSDSETEQVLDHYRTSFRPSERLAAPHTMISVMLASGDSDADVRREMRLSEITFLRMLSGRPADLVTAEEADRHVLGPREREIIEHRNRRQAIGTPDLVESRLSDLVASTGVDELMLQLTGSDPDGRVRSLEIVSGLTASAATV